MDHRRSAWRSGRQALLAAVIGAIVLCCASVQAEAAGDVCSVTVSLLLGQGTEKKPLKAHVDLVFQSTKRDVRKTSNDAGVIEVDLEPGTWRVEKRTTKSEPYWIEETAVEVPPGQTSLEVEVVLHKTRQFEVTGLLLNKADSTPLPGVSILKRSIGKDSYRRMAVTDDEGKFALRWLWEHEPHVLLVWNGDIDGRQLRTITVEELEAGSLVWKVPVLPPAPVIKIRLMGRRHGKRVPLTAEFTGRAWDERFLPLLRCSPVLRDPETGDVRGTGSQRSHEIDVHGICLLKRLPPAEFFIQSLEVTVPGSRELTFYYPVDGDLRFVVPAEGADVVEVETVFGSEPLQLSVRGKVLDESTALPVARATITVGQSTGLASEEITADDQGEFELRVPPSVVELYVQGQGFLPASKTLYVTGDTSIEFQLESVYVYAGIVVDADGDPVEFASLFLEQKEQRRHLQTHRDGLFSFGSLRPGTYTLRAFGPRHFSLQQEIKISADVKDASITLEKGALVTGHTRFDEGTRPDTCLSLFFVDPKTLSPEGGGVIDKDGRHITLVRKKHLIVYLRRHKGQEPTTPVVAFYKLGEIEVNKDEMTVDLHVTKEILDNPIDPEKLQLK